MKLVSRLLDWFWFPEAPAARLAILRILIGGFAFYLMADHYSSWVKIGRTNASLFEPVGVVAVLDKYLDWLLTLEFDPGGIVTSLNMPHAPEVFQGLLIACLVANAVFMLGWQHRYTGPAFAVLLLWVLTYRNSWSMIYHSANLVVLHVLILGLAPAADALSLDAWRARRQTGRIPAIDWRYGWPIRLICAVTVITYLLAGVAKVKGELGWSWGTGEALRSQVAADTLRKEVLGETGSSLIYPLYDHVWLFTILAVGSLVMELGAPLVMFNKRLGRWWAVNAFLMHWGIFFIMGITFRYHLTAVVFASFFNVERLLPWLWPSFIQKGLGQAWSRLASRKAVPGPTATEASAIKQSASLE